MKAVVYTKTGNPDVLQVKELPCPRPKAKQVLIKVKACALNVADIQPFEQKKGKIPLSVRAMNLALGRKGKPIGAEIAGIAVKVGQDISHIRPGDLVFGKSAGFAPVGGCAEYALMDEKRVALMPESLSFEEAASLSISFDAALGAVNKGRIKSGDQVLVYGASGGVGSFAVQLAKVRGARVTGVCSGRNRLLALENGCSQVVDYQKEDFRKLETRFDVILGINGYNPMSDYQKLLKEDGIFVGVGNAKQGMAALAKSFSSKQFPYLAGILDPQEDYLNLARQLVEKGQLKTHLDQIFSVYQTKEAISYLLTEHAQGKVVIHIDF